MTMFTHALISKRFAARETRNSFPRRQLRALRSELRISKPQKVWNDSTMNCSSQAAVASLPVADKSTLHRKPLSQWSIFVETLLPDTKGILSLTTSVSGLWIATQSIGLACGVLQK